MYNQMRYDRVTEALPKEGFSESATLTPAQREAIVAGIVERHGDTDISRVALMAKSDLYLITRYNLSIQYAKRDAELDGKDAERARAKAKADGKSDEREGRDAADPFDSYGRPIYGTPHVAQAYAERADAAYRQGVEDLNSWRTRADSECPSVHGGLPQRAQAHPQPAPSATRADAASAQAAYEKNVADLNAWRDGE